MLSRHVSSTRAAKRGVLGASGPGSRPWTHGHRSRVSVSPPAGSSVCEPPHSQKQSAGYLPVSFEECGPCTHTRAGTHTLQSARGLPGPRDSCLPRTALPRSPRDAGHPGGVHAGCPSHTTHTAAVALEHGDRGNQRPNHTLSYRF